MKEMYRMQSKSQADILDLHKNQNQNPAWSDLIERPHVPNAKDFDCMTSTYMNKACKKAPSGAAAD